MLRLGECDPESRETPCNSALLPNPPCVPSFLTQWYSDPCAMPEDSAPLAANSEVEYLGVMTAVCGSGESYAIVRMFRSSIDASGQVTVQDGMGYVPSSDLGFCAGKSDCGANTCGTTAGTELTNSCTEDAQCCSCQCTPFADFARSLGRTDNPTEITLIDGDGGENVFTFDPAAASAAGASPSLVLADRVCTNLDQVPATTACPSKVYVRDFATICAACPDACKQSGDEVIDALVVRAAYSAACMPGHITYRQVANVFSRIPDFHHAPFRITLKT